MTEDHTSGEPDGTQAARPRLSETLDGATPLLAKAGVLAGSLPRRFGDYELLEVLGRGGMGVVYKARQLSLDRIVAVKMILGGHLASGNDVQRFYLEAKAAGKLSHPNIVAVHEIDELDGNPFYSMDYIEGLNLAELIRDKPLPPERAARYLKTIAEAIHAAHEDGILHRDLKPQNVLIDSHDQPQITDFGLAKQVGDHSGLTVTGTALGTPSYMSPEQASGKPGEVTRISDVYSLGAILYVLLTGRAPFRQETVLETIQDVISTEPATPRSINPSADRDLETICLKCLQKKPARRYQTAAELAADLNRYLRGEPILAKPISRLSRTVHWLRNIPLLAAVVGGRHLEPTVWQKRANWALVVLPLLVSLALLLWRWRPEMLPAQIRIATGAAGGLYEQFGRAYGQRLEGQTARSLTVLTTSGSVENATLLLTRKAEVALLQENAIASRDITVAAPLYYDAVHFIVRHDSRIRGLGDLAGACVSLGPDGSGMRLTSLKILAADGRIRPGELAKSETHFAQLLTDPDMAAALVTTGCRNADLRAVLASRLTTLLSLDEALIEKLSLRYPSLRPYIIRRGEIAAAADGQTAIPASDVRTVATTTFLAVRRDATDRWVTTLLRTLYRDPALSRDFGLIGAAEATHWQEFALHPAAFRFFQGLDPSE